METFDTGLPVTQAKGQAARAAENFRYFADVIVAQHEDAFSQPGQLGYVLRKPAGVAGLITPWNTPFMLESWKLAPALASGCAVVLKPAEWTPLSASLLPEIMTEAGVPDGVFNIVHGIGEQAGAALVAHPGVPLISFTGETTTGQVIMRSAADHLKGLSMELGGKSPCVIFADADLDAAIDSALFGVMSLNGERCTAGSRILAERAVYDAVVARLAERADRVKVGDPSDPATEIGALVHPEHYERVMSYVRLGAREGARLVAGGRRPAGLADGELPGGDGVRGREAVDADLPGGDLRPGGLRDAVRVRGGGRRAGQRDQVRARRLPVDVGPAPRAPGRRAGGIGYDLGELAQRAGPADPVRRGEEQRARPGGRAALDRLLHRVPDRARRPGRHPRTALRRVRSRLEQS